MSRNSGIIAVFAVVGLLSTDAKAHPLLDDAIVSYEDADFRAALRTFNLAARDADLSLEELLVLFEMRALVHHALGNETAMLRDLERVGALRPGHELGGLAPPRVREAYAEMLEANGGTLGVELVIEEKVFEGKPYVVARVERVPKGLVHHVSLQCRIPPSGRTIARTTQGTRARIALPDSGEHEGCEARAATRRRTLLFGAAIEGTRTPAPPPQPMIPALPNAPASPPTVLLMPEREGQIDEPTTKKRKKWPWFVAAAAVAVAGGVTAGVILSQRSSQTEPPPAGVTVAW